MLPPFRVVPEFAATGLAAFRLVRSPTPHTPLPRRPPRTTRRTRRASRKLCASGSSPQRPGPRWRRRSSGPRSRGPSGSQQKRVGQGRGPFDRWPW